MENKLKIRGARHHNLKNIDVDIPKNKLVVISGLSGSGKSTLAFDTIYAEGQRRYVESLSSYARQFLEMMDKPDVDTIEGLSPAISIQQKTTSKNPRSTVGTTTEIYDYLRLLYARIGTPYCPKCNRKISTQSVDTICDSVLRDFVDKKILVLAPKIQRKKGTHESVLDKIKQDGYSRIRLNGEIHNLDDEIPTLDRQKWHNIEIVVDRIQVEKQERSRLFEAIQTAINASNGQVLISSEKTEDIFSQSNSCPHCGVTIGELEPRTFSFNSPFGMCKVCNGIGTKLEFDPDLLIPDQNLSILQGAIKPLNMLMTMSSHQMNRTPIRVDFDLDLPIKYLNSGQLEKLFYGKNGIRGYQTNIKYHEYPDKNDGLIGNLWHHYNTSYYGLTKDRLKRYMRVIPCGICNGNKLKPEALAVRINDLGIMDVCNMSIEKCYNFFFTINLNKTQEYIARDILKEVKERLEFLKNVGLSYLTLNRRSSTLSGGESQRIRLATQIGSNLTGVLYVLDEPTIGLHQRDNTRLVKTLTKLRNIGNTIIVVEHDEEVIRSADWILDLGPGAGINGGDLVFEGTVNDILGEHKSITGDYLKNKIIIKMGKKIRNRSGSLKIIGAAENNLKNIDVEIPLGFFVTVTGVSGSGKSTLVNDILLNTLENHFNRSNHKVGRHSKITGVKNIDKVIAINQSPIGRTPRSNPATYIGLFTPIREIFTKTPMAKERGYSPGQFSFNVNKGRCTECEGGGVKQIEMQFLSDVYVKCDECNGKRYNSETLSILYKGKNISDVLEMTVFEALQLFENVPVIKRKLQTLHDVGLGYIKLGQSATTLSGGEAQRIKLASELSKIGTGKTLYILDEPTTGLHFADVQKLLDVLNRLANKGNTIVVIEHNMDVIRNSDWIIDMGPEGGEMGGNIVAAGAPKEVAMISESHTGKYLKNVIQHKQD